MAWDVSPEDLGDEVSWIERMTYQWSFRPVPLIGGIGEKYNHPIGNILCNLSQTNSK